MSHGLLPLLFYSVYPEMFDKDKKALIDTASSFLEDPISLKCDDTLKITTYSDYKDERFSRPSFNIDVAKCLLVLSALIYERKDPKEINRTDYPIHFTESAPYNEFIKKTAKSWIEPGHGDGIGQLTDSHFLREINGQMFADRAIRRTSDR